MAEAEKQPQRVTVSEVRGRFKVGTIIYKCFSGIPYKGKIIEPYDGRFYQIEYEDGDEEEMSHTDVKKFLPKIPYTAGYGAAMQAIIIDNASLNVIAIDSLLKAQNRAFAVTHPITGKQMEYRDLVKDPKFRKEWLLSKSNELGRLMQGAGRNPDGTQRIKGYDCCDAICKHEVEDGRTVTYARTVCTVRPEKEEENRTRVTAGGNLLDYPGDTSTDTAGLELIKIH